jgi:hypothetical protein
MYGTVWRSGATFPDPSLRVNRKTLHIYSIKLFMPLPELAFFGIVGLFWKV